MTRRSRTPSPASARATTHVDSEPSAELILKPDPVRERLTILAKEHSRLLKDIGKKRAQLQATEELVRELSTTLAVRTEPVRHRLQEELRTIQATFKTLLSPESHLKRTEKAKVRRVYAEVSEVFGFKEEDPAVTDEIPPVKPRGKKRNQHEHRDEASSHGAGGYSASKPTDDGSKLRALFRKLAIAFHPDKVRDEATKAERTSLMKDVTRAYEAGDLARLVEMERSLLAQSPPEDDAASFARRIDEMVQMNTELRRQLRSLTSDLKLAAMGLPLDVNLKAPNAREAANAEIASLVAALEKEERRVVALREFVSDFADGRIDLTTFLAGPDLHEDSVDHDEIGPIYDDFGEDLLDELLQHLHARPQKSRRTHGKKRR
jgi:hypothetical protein